MDYGKIPYILKIIRDKQGEIDKAMRLLEKIQHQSLNDPIFSFDLDFVRAYAPGHFYTPLPSNEEIQRVAPRVWKPVPDALPDIDLNTQDQHRLLEKFAKLYQELPLWDGEHGPLRYHFDNGFFSYADAIFFYSFLREFKPRRIIEIGSGYSTCVALDVNELFFQNEISCTCIEPYPDRLLSLLRPDDASRVKIVQEQVENLSLDFFSSLSANDILFIDSSHVGKIGSDVLYELFEILPRLREGVIIHFHDVFYPFQYPREWVESFHRAWNEAYFLRAFLQNNQAFKILFFNDYLGKLFPDLLEKATPLALKNTGGSLWMRKVAS